MLAEEFAQICIDLEFMRVGIQRSACLKLSDFAATDLEILLVGVRYGVLCEVYGLTFGVNSASSSSTDVFFVV